jgi:hypothetical protein
MLVNLARRLRDEHPGAAASLNEGLEETLSVKRLKLPRKLERQLSTTNAIENLMGSVRELARRVKRWRGGAMIQRWTVTAVAISTIPEVHCETNVKAFSWRQRVHKITTSRSAGSFETTLVASMGPSASVDGEPDVRGAPRSVEEGAASVLFGVTASETGGVFRDGERIAP